MGETLAPLPHSLAHSFPEADADADAAAVAFIRRDSEGCSHVHTQAHACRLRRTSLLPSCAPCLVCTLDPSFPSVVSGIMLF